MINADCEMRNAKCEIRNDVGLGFEVFEFFSSIAE